MQFTLSNATPPKQFLKWIGNKQRFAPQIVSNIADDFETYIEPFVGSAAVLGCLAPNRGIAGDIFPQLIALWKLLKTDPQSLIEHYGQLRERFLKARGDVYLSVRASYNQNPNPHDLLFISRSCYGGVMRFRKSDGFISTPIGPHTPISTESLASRVKQWRERLKGTTFAVAHFADTMSRAKHGDVVYCDPPYKFSQAILYGAQDFKLTELWEAIERCKRRGAKVLLSIDGHKKSGSLKTNVDIPDGLFEREHFVDCGRSMLLRFRKEGETLEDEVVHDRLLMTW
jgi:DNA adenine methylase